MDFSFHRIRGRCPTRARRRASHECAPSFNDRRPLSPKSGDENATRLAKPCVRHGPVADGAIFFGVTENDELKSAKGANFWNGCNVAAGTNHDAFRVFARHRLRPHRTDGPPTALQCLLQCPRIAPPRARYRRRVWKDWRNAGKVSPRRPLQSRKKLPLMNLKTESTARWVCFGSATPTLLCRP